MATFSHVGFVQQSFLQFRMNIVIVVDLLARLVELSPVMCDFRAHSFYPYLIDLKTFGRFHKWLDGSHSHMPEPMNRWPTICGHRLQSCQVEVVEFLESFP